MPYLELIHNHEHKRFWCEKGTRTLTHTQIEIYIHMCAMMKLVRSTQINPPIANEFSNLT